MSISTTVDSSKLQLKNCLQTSSKSPVNKVIYTNDGRYCLTCGVDKLIYLWNPTHVDDRDSSGVTSNHTFITTYKGHGYEIDDVVSSFDSMKLASAGGDRAAYVWDTTKAVILRKCFGHSQRVTSVLFNDTATLLFTGSSDKLVHIYDLKAPSGPPIQTLEQAHDSISGIFQLDNNIITTSLDSAIRIYDIRFGNVCVDTVSIGNIAASALSLSKKSLLVSCLKRKGDLSSEDEGIVGLYDFVSGQILQTYRGRHSNLQYRCIPAVDNTETEVIVPSENGNLILYDLMKGSSKHVVERAHSRVISSVAVNPQPSQTSILTSSFDGSVKLWIRA
jgi:mitogen-activated protein kinase organizer 1